MYNLYLNDTLLFAVSSFILLHGLGEVMELSEPAEEVATFYAKMLEHDYTKKEIFNKNFFEDWRKEMTDQERKTIKKLEKCNFKEMAAYFAEVNASTHCHRYKKIYTCSQNTSSIMIIMLVNKSCFGVPFS